MLTGIYEQILLFYVHAVLMRTIKHIQNFFASQLISKTYGWNKFLYKEVFRPNTTWSRTSSLRVVNLRCEFNAHSTSAFVVPERILV